jgi:dTDP-glucose 4,6-dehydratase
LRVLITGAAGFIGTNLTRLWADEHPDDQLVALDALTYAGNRANLADLETMGRITFVHGDIGDVDLVSGVLREHRIDVVVNVAAESHNSLAVLDPGRFFATNVMGTQRLLEACRTVGVARFHHVSTCEVYGDLPLEATAAEAFTEESAYQPRTPYNASKAGADHAVRAYHETYGLPISITNCANNFGPYQFPEKVLPVFVTRALDGEPLPVYASANHRREWIHVLDHARAIDTVVREGRDGATYHVGTGVERDVTQLADSVLAALDLPADRRVTVPDRPGHDRRYLLDSSRIRTELGWTPTIDVDKGFTETARWYANNRAWWEPLRDRAPVDESAWSTAAASATIRHGA